MQITPLRSRPPPVPGATSPTTPTGSPTLMDTPLRIALLACVSYLLLAHTASTAPVELDVPALDSPDPEASSYVHLDVTAGPSGAPYGFPIEGRALRHFDALG